MTGWRQKSYFLDGQRLKRTTHGTQDRATHHQRTTRNSQNLQIALYKPQPDKERSSKEQFNSETH